MFKAVQMHLHYEFINLLKDELTLESDMIRHKSNLFCLATKAFVLL